MITVQDEEMTILRKRTAAILRELRFGVHRLGYRQLLLMIPRYARDGELSLSKELYPYAAASLGQSAWQAVEHAVRIAIQDAWERGGPAVWERYFPGLGRVPSNKRFIATIAEWIKNAPPGGGGAERLPRGYERTWPNP